MKNMIDSVMRWGTAILGVFMMGFAVYMALTPDVTVEIREFFIACGFLAGSMLVFTNADRNVYKERLENLFTLVGTTDHKIERYEYTNYRFTEPSTSNENDSGETQNK